jgi:multidrug efflux pump subunit AcrB
LHEDEQREVAGSGLDVLTGSDEPLVDGAELSLGSAVGLLALLGLAVRVSVLSIRRLQDLERAEDALRRAAQGASGRS